MASKGLKVFPSAVVLQFATFEDMYPQELRTGREGEAGKRSVAFLRSLVR